MWIFIGIGATAVYCLLSWLFAVYTAEGRILDKFYEFMSDHSFLGELSHFPDDVRINPTLYFFIWWLYFICIILGIIHIIFKIPAFICRPAIKIFNNLINENY